MYNINYEYEDKILPGEIHSIDWCMDPGPMYDEDLYDREEIESYYGDPREIYSPDDIPF